MNRMGIGKKIFEYVVNQFKEKDRKVMIIWCLKDNYPSRMFYEKMGGIPTESKIIEIGGKEYEEVGFKYNLKNI